MNEETWERLALWFEDQGEDWHGEPAAAEEVKAASRAVGVPFADDYREFLLRYGSAAVGRWDVLGIKPAPKLRSNWSLVAATEWFRSDWWPATEDWAIIAVDLSGNPIGLAPDGRVWIAHHDCPGPPREGGRWMFPHVPFGAIEPIYDSFEEFLLACLEDCGY